MFKAILEANDAIDQYRAKFRGGAAAGMGLPINTFMNNENASAGYAMGNQNMQNIPQQSSGVYDSYVMENEPQNIPNLGFGRMGIY